MKRGAALALLACGCAAPSQLPEPGPLARHAEITAAAEGVPRDLFLAVAHVEEGLLLPRWRVAHDDDHVPVAGILELRHGRFDSLARGAALVGESETRLREDTDLGTLAGARVLAELGRLHGARPDDLASWRGAVAELSGLGDGPVRDAYLARVFTTLRDGGALPARDGETVHIAAHRSIGADAIGEIRAALGGPPPDYPGAMWLDTNCDGKCTAGRPDGNAAVDKIVIHDTEGGWNASVATLQFDKGKSVHYIIDADGSRVGQFLHEVDTGWHAGNWYYNKRSIGLEHVGFAADPKGYQAGLYVTSAKLVANIRTRWKVPLDRAHIIGHYQIPDGGQIAETSPPCSDHITVCEKNPKYGGASNHWDPGFYWQWCQYMQRLGGKCTCADAYDLWNCTTDLRQAVRCKGGMVEIAECAPCEPKPVGTADVCHMAPPAPDLASAPAADLVTATFDLAAAIPDAAAADGAPARMTMNAEGGCGCRVARRAPSPLLAGLPFALLLARRRRN